jgi:hypothetical protein
MQLYLTLIILLPLLGGTVNALGGGIPGTQFEIWRRGNNWGYTPVISSDF